MVHYLCYIHIRYILMLLKNVGMKCECEFNINMWIEIKSHIIIEFENMKMGRIIPMSILSLCLWFCDLMYFLGYNENVEWFENWDY